MNDNTQREPITDGNCFEVAAHVVTCRRMYRKRDGNSPEAKCIRAMEFAAIRSDTIKLVHGMVTRKTDGFRHCHAWVEATKVIEFSGDQQEFRQVLVFDFANDKEVVYPQHLYYEAGEIVEGEQWKYTADAARHRLVDEENYGPWDAEDFS